MINIKSIKYPWLLLISLALACSHTNKHDNRILTDSEIYGYGHKYTNWFLSHELDSLINCIVDKEYTIHTLREFRERLDGKIGKEIRIINELIMKGKSQSYLYYYVRYSNFSKVERPVKIIFSFDNNNNILGFSVETLPPEAPTEYLNYQTKTRLQLPFKGEWFVSWGGRSINHNQHVVSTDQRFAYDFLIRNEGFTYSNDGKRNEDYFCYNKKIIAPGSGVMVEVLNHIDENRPGQRASPSTSGNYVVIDHENGEFSILSHFKKCSIAVKPGDKINIGQFLGLSGNSGDSSEPHLHYHLQNTPVLFEGEGLPAQFQFYSADGEPVRKGEPLWGQKVRNINE